MTATQRKHLGLLRAVPGTSVTQEIQRRAAHRQAATFQSAARWMGPSLRN